MCARGSNRALLGAPSTHPLDVALDSPSPPLGPFARAFVAINRIFGAFTLLGGLYLLAYLGWCSLRGAAPSSLLYPALFGLGMVVVGIVYLRAPLLREPRKKSRGTPSQDR